MVSCPGNSCSVITASVQRYGRRESRTAGRPTKTNQQIRERKMSVLQNKIDFAAVLRVKHANPNGDPLNGNRPRTDYNGFGEITDVCLKRKIRDRLQDAGLDIFVQSDDRKKDDATSLRDRAEKTLGKKFGSAETTTD